MIDLGTSPFTAAVEKLSAGTPIGSILKTAEWELLPLELRESAFFSATIESSKWLEAAQSKILAAVSQTREKVARGTALMDRSVFIAEMRKLGTELGLRPTDPGKVDTLQDPLSTRRLRLIFDIQTARAAGHAEWKMGNDADYLDAFPAQELVRKEERKAHRVWLKRWEAAGGGIYSGRMVALKTDEVWTRISRFGTPWPPFDFQSGMGLVELDRDEAELLGLITMDDVPEPQPLPFTENMQADVSSMSPRFVAGLKAIFGDQVAIADGKAMWTAKDAKGAKVVMNTGEYRRDKIGRFAKESGGGLGASPIGKEGDWKSLGLPDAIHIPATADKPSRMDHAEAMEKLARPYKKTDPLGMKVEFGERLEGHMEERSGERRAEWLSHAEATVEKPAEIWADVTEKGPRIRHIGVFRSANGTKSFLVVSHQVGEEEARSVTIVPKAFRALKKERKGRLLYTSYGEGHRVRTDSDSRGTHEVKPLSAPREFNAKSKGKDGEVKR